MAMKFDEKAIRNTEICKKQAQKQANFKQNKPKNKQPASLQKNPHIHKKTSPNSREKRKVGSFIYYFHCIEPREFLTFRQPVLLLDIISRTELLEGETIVNTPKQ